MHTPQVEQLLSHYPAVKKVHLAPEAVLLTPGQTCQQLVVVKEGQVTVQRPAADGRVISLYHIQANQSCVLSTGCILNDKPFPALASCLTAVEAYLVPAAIVRKWTRENEAWRAFMFETLSQRLGNLIELVDSLIHKTLQERLLDWLQTNAVLNPENEKSGSENQPGKPSVDRTHQQIADELGTSREVVSRALKQLEKAGKVRLQRVRVVLTANGP